MTNLGDIPANSNIATANSVLPAGMLAPFAGAAAPSGWLLCDGSAVSRSTFAALYSALGGAGSPYGQGDGSTTFNLPDTRGRVPVGKGTHADVDTLGDNDGTALASRRVLHTHTVASHTHPVSAEAPGTGTSGSHSHGIQTDGETGHTFFTGGPYGGMPSGSTGIGHIHGGGTDTQGSHSHTVNSHSHGGVSGSTAPATDAVGSAYLTVNYIVKT